MENLLVYLIIVALALIGCFIVHILSGLIFDLLSLVKALFRS